MIVVYTTCESAEKAKEIGEAALKKRLVACINIYPQMYSMSLWPPKCGQVEKGNEVVLLLKTLERNFAAVEKLIKKMSTYECPCIFAYAVTNVSKEYYGWIKGEVI